MEQRLEEAVAFFELNLPLDQEIFSNKWVEFALSTHPDKPGGNANKVSNPF